MFGYSLSDILPSAKDLGLPSGEDFKNGIKNWFSGMPGFAELRYNISTSFKGFMWWGLNWIDSWFDQKWPSTGRAPYIETALNGLIKTGGDGTPLKDNNGAPVLEPQTTTINGQNVDYSPIVYEAVRKSDYGFGRVAGTWFSNLISRVKGALGAESSAGADDSSKAESKAQFASQIVYDRVYKEVLNKYGYKDYKVAEFIATPPTDSKDQAAVRVAVAEAQRVSGLSRNVTKDDDGSDKVAYEAIPGNKGLYAYLQAHANPDADATKKTFKPAAPDQMLIAQAQDIQAAEAELNTNFQNLHAELQTDTIRKTLANRNLIDAGEYAKIRNFDAATAARLATNLKSGFVAAAANGDTKDWKFVNNNTALAIEVNVGGKIRQEIAVDNIQFRQGFVVADASSDTPQAPPSNGASGQVSEPAATRIN